MRIPFITNKKTLAPALTIGEESSTSENITSPSDRLGIAVIRMGDCSAVAGGPQVQNEPTH